MAFSHTNSKGVTYYLHSTTRTLKSGKTQTLYFFAKDVRNNALNEIPNGFRISESKSGLPILARAAGPHGGGGGIDD
jgi:hypothetical protein